MTPQDKIRKGLRVCIWSKHLHFICNKLHIIITVFLQFIHKLQWKHEYEICFVLFSTGQTTSKEVLSTHLYIVLLTFESFSCTKCDVSQYRYIFLFKSKEAYPPTICTAFLFFMSVCMLNCFTCPFCPYVTVMGQ